MTGHAPGAWEVSLEESPLDFQMELTVVAGSSQVCYFIDVNEETRANARLIAAAPDLLEAIQDLMEAGEEAWGPDRPCVRTARLAISKATKGKQ